MPLCMSFLQRRDNPPVREVAVVDHELPASTAAERSWRDIYERLYPRLCRSAARLVGSGAAHDAVTDGLLEVRAKWSQLAPEERTDAFVRRAVRFRVIDEYRRQQKLVEFTLELEESGAVPVLPAPEAPSDLAVTVDRLIAAMPPQRRAVCILVYEDGLKLREVAEELGIAFETARTHLKLAHAFLRKHMPPDLLGFRLGSGEGPPRLRPGTGSRQGELEQSGGVS